MPQVPYLLQGGTNGKNPHVKKYSKKLIIIKQGVLMSKKRMMSKQQRLYYEYANKERVQKELTEYLKQLREHQDKYRSYYNHEHLL